MNKQDVTRLLEDDVGVLDRNTVSKVAIGKVREDLRRILKYMKKGLKK